jgi:hypothetical protein
MQVTENKDAKVWRVNCYIEGASDVPAAEKIPGSPKNGRRPARTIAIERPSKGQSSRENLLIGTVDNHRPTLKLGGQ